MPATKKEVIFMENVKNLPCVDCDAPPISEFDHWVIGRRLGNFYGNPRCVECHRGNKKTSKTVLEEAILYKKTCLEVGHPFILPPMKELNFWERRLGEHYEELISN